MRGNGRFSGRQIEGILYVTMTTSLTSIAVSTGIPPEEIATGASIAVNFPTLNRVKQKNTLSFC